MSLRALWPLATLTIFAAALRLATLDQQSFWYDEAFTPVHVLHPGLWATLRSVVHTENTPPLWYLLAWADARVLGTGEVALRVPSALAGIATVPVAWAIGRQLTGRDATAIAAGALVAVNPLLVWYSQEARAYALFVLLASIAMLCFVRALASPMPGRMAAFALAGVLALLTHYFAVFLLIPMAIWLLWNPATRRAAAPGLAALGLAGAALVPLILAQGGHGTQWIGAWALTSRLQAIPQYYLTGYTGAALGHGIELLVAAPIIAGLGFGLWRVLTPREERAALLCLAVAAGGILLPLALAAAGADYLAPRNLVAAMIPVSVLIAVVVPSVRAGLVGVILAGLIAAGFAAVSIDVNLSPRLQRGDWRGLARVLAGWTPPGAGAAGGIAAGGTAPSGGTAGGAAGHPIGPGAEAVRAITTVELGAAPLEYYLPRLGLPRQANLPRGTSARVSEIDETGYAPLRPSAGTPPAEGFRLVARRNVHGLIVYRFVSAAPRIVTEATLRRHVIALAHPEVLVPAAAQRSP